MPCEHPRTMKILRMFWLGLRLRSPFRLVSDGYVNFFRQETLPNDDTGIVALTVRRDLYFLIEIDIQIGIGYF